MVVSMNSPIEDVQWRPFVSGGVYEHVQLAQVAWDHVLCGFHDFRANSWMASAWLLTEKRNLVKYAQISRCRRDGGIPCAFITVRNHVG